MRCNGAGLAWFYKWKVNSPGPLIAAVIRLTNNMPYRIAIVEPAFQFNMEMQRVASKAYPRFVISSFETLPEFVKWWLDRSTDDFTLLCTATEEFNCVDRVSSKFHIISHAAADNRNDQNFASLEATGWRITRCNELHSFDRISNYWGLFVAGFIGTESDFFDGTDHAENLRQM